MVGVVLLLTGSLVVACDREQDPVERFYDAVERGAECDELQRLQREIDVPDRQVHLQVGRKLEDLGCVVFIEDAFD